MRKTTMSGFAMAAAALLAAGSASAQVCAGFPTTDGQGTIGALANFPTGFNEYGAEGSYNFTGPLAVNAGYIYSDTNDNHTNTFRGGVAFDVATAPGNFRSTVSICPNVRADYASRDGTFHVTRWQVPVGLGVGTSTPLGGPGTNLTLHIIPALYWTHVRAESDDFPEFGGTQTDTNFGVRAGFELNFDRFYLGAISEWVDPFDSQSEAVVGVRAGVKF
ncbi:MAG: hypothetical protein ACJ8GN_11755 [Longimicrobiaceae bacterium]